MKVGPQELTYCLNVHPGETLEHVHEVLRHHASRVKNRLRREGALGAHEPFGVGLRLSATAARALRDPAALAALKLALEQEELYAFTVNGFPYGNFHGAPVKDGVYLPDWADPLRAAYTRDLFDALVGLLPPEGYGSVSTVPLGFRAHGKGAAPERLAHMAHALTAQVGDLALLEQRTGRRLCLALEPEPGCLLETTPDVVAFFADHLRAETNLKDLALRCGVSRDAAAELLTAHLGVCLDTCHAGVEFEDAGAAVAALSAAAIPIHKVQLSSGLRLQPNAASLAAIARYDEPVYLHQVVARTGSELTRFDDLPQALNSPAARAADEWRVHFHVPIHTHSYGAFDSTQDFITDLLASHRQSPLCTHFEVETYTWDVLPDRSSTLEDSLVSELLWAKKGLGG